MKKLTLGLNLNETGSTKIITSLFAENETGIVKHGNIYKAKVITIHNIKTMIFKTKCF